MTTLRCCAVGFRLDPARATSSTSFAAAVAAVLDDHVVPNPHGPTLVAFPEHVGLLAMLVGSRGEAARERLAARASLTEALTALAVGYVDALGYYARAFPDVRSPGQLLHLACTDTVVRTITRTFGVLAADRGLWLTVGAALPDWVRRTDVDVAALCDPGMGPEVAGEPDAGACVAAGPHVRNRNLLFAPDGSLVAVHDKAYLVPMEQDAEAGLGLSAAGIDEVDVADLVIGRVATVISKDAWMPDVNDRLDQLGAQVLIQPEAFDRWGRVDRGDGLVDLWPPDKFQRGGWWMVQRHPAFRVNLAPMLVGNLGELAFDGQPLIAVSAPHGRTGLGLLGQPHDAGWAAVGLWDHLDEPAGSLADDRRRGAFEARARKMAPGSGDPLEGAVAESVAWADVRLPVRPPPAPPVTRATDLPPSVAVAPGGMQLAPDLTGGGERAWLAWIACDERHRQVVVAAAGDGRHWAAPELVSPPEGSLDADAADAADAATDRRWRPRLAVVDGSVVCLHLGFPAGNWDLFISRRDERGRWSEPDRVDDAHAERGVLRERGHDAPVLVSDGEALVAVWSDLRWPWVFPQVRLARSDDGGRSWSSSERVDGGSLVGQSDPLAPRSPHETRGQTAPAVGLAGDGGLLVAWQERAEVGAAIRLVRLDRPSGTGVGTRAGPVGGRGPRPTGNPVAPVGEQGGIAHRPVLAADADACWLAWESWPAGGGAALMVVGSHDSGRSWSAPVAIDPDRPSGTTQRRATIVPIGGGAAVIVLEDDRTGRGHIVASRLDAAGVAGPLRRIDDAPPGADARAPTAACVGRDLVVAWQDTRGGREHVRTTRIAAPMLES